MKTVMCTLCKLDKCGICDYNCIKKHNDFLHSLIVCPKFIYDDKTPLTNAELLCVDLKQDTSLAATGLWYQLAMEGGFDDYEEFLTWLNKPAILD